MDHKQCVTNKTFDAINVGDRASITRTLTKQDIELFAAVSGDKNPAHLDENFAKDDLFHHIVGHGMWTGALFSAVLGLHLPGPGTIYLSQQLRFKHPVYIDDTVTATVTVTAKNEEKKTVTFETSCTNQDNKVVVTGEAVVLAPTSEITWPIPALPDILLKHSGSQFTHLLETGCKGLSPLITAVVHPTDLLSLQGAIAAAEAGIIVPILIGPEDKIRKTAEEGKLDISPYQLIPTYHSHAAAEMAVQLVREAKVEALMKGKLTSEELMGMVVDKEKGIRTGRRMSHVFVMDIPEYPKPLFLTDAALNIQPNLMDKRDIVQNAIDLFQALQLGEPKVALLSAVETVNEKIPSTLDATALCKMAERGQITGGILDGPLAFDNAISKESARIKNITSAVAGDADILVVPDLESGNMLYKQLSYFSNANGAGIVLGAKVPIILTSRSSDNASRIHSSALALKWARRVRHTNV